MAIFPDKGDSGRDLFPVRQIAFGVCLAPVQEGNVTVIGKNEKAFFCNIIDGPGHGIPHFGLFPNGFRRFGQVLVHLHGDGRPAALIPVQLDPDFLVGVHPAQHFRIRQEHAPFRPDVHKAAIPGHADDFRVTQLSFFHLGQLHAGGETPMGVQIQVHPHFVPHFHRRGLLQFVQQDVVRSVTGARIQKGAHVGDPDHFQRHHVAGFVLQVIVHHRSPRRLRWEHRPTAVPDYRNPVLLPRIYAPPRRRNPSAPSGLRYNLPCGCRTLPVPPAYPQWHRQWPAPAWK